MNKFLKKNKIVDCFFFYDEIEMLHFRLKELDPYVNYFIIIEGKVDFKNNPKKINFNFEDTLFDDFREKIIHLVYDKFDKNSLKLIYENLKNESKLRSFDESKISKFDIIDFALNSLREKILSLDLQFDDLILVSDVDEIPDLSDPDTIIEYTKYDSLIFRQTNFVWSNQFYETYPHFGTCVFTKSKLLTEPEDLLFFYEQKLKGLNLSFTILNNGYHFSHFYDYERTLNKLNLLHEPTDNVVLTKSGILESMRNLIHPCQIKKPYLHTLVEYSGPLPKNIHLLNNQVIGRIWSKNFLVLVNPSEETKHNELISDYHQPFFINFTEEYIKRTTLQNEYDIFAPGETYYQEDTISLDKFRYVYCLNEINKVLNRHLLLSHDFVIISLNNYVPSSEEIKMNLKKNDSYYDSEKKYVIIKWEVMRNSIISDLISDIL
jgi:beta-1,4-mannosyl-glycoprotein beta-1,4-N-acetylglucosaminyltransferase